MPIIYHISSLQKINHTSQLFQMNTTGKFNTRNMSIVTRIILDEIKQTNTFQDKLSTQVKKKIIENNNKKRKNRKW